MYVDRKAGLLRRNSAVALPSPNSSAYCTLTLLLQNQNRGDQVSDSFLSLPSNTFSAHGRKYKCERTVSDSVLGTELCGKVGST